MKGLEIYYHEINKIYLFRGVVVPQRFKKLAIEMGYPKEEKFEG